MIDDIAAEIYDGLIRAGPARLKFTREAFHMIPKLHRPRILDIGCGEGGPTLELAKLSDGEVIGLDIHQPFLDRLATRIEETGLSDRVQGSEGIHVRDGLPE